MSAESSPESVSPNIPPKPPKPPPKAWTVVAWLALFLGIGAAVFALTGFVYGAVDTTNLDSPWIKGLKAAGGAARCFFFAGAAVFAGLFMGTMLAMKVLPNGDGGSQADASTTNLQVMADWLLKAFTGGGLIELKTILRALLDPNSALGRVASAALPVGILPSAAVLVALFFGIGGTLLGYFWLVGRR